MKKYLFVGAMLLLMGGGCESANQPTLEDMPNDEMNFEASNDEDLSAGRVADPIAFPSGNWEMYMGQGYVIPVDATFQPRWEGSRLRIQNFEGQDDPRFDYADDAFFIEITNVENDMSEEFRGDHGQVDEAALAGEPVLKGTERAVGGESWPGHSYLNTERGVYIRVSYLHPEASVIAEAILSHLSWE